MKKINVNGKTMDFDGDENTPLLWALRELEGTEEITTIEGLSKDGTHPVQQAWAELDIPQCGYCQAGMMMAVSALLKENPNATDQDIDDTITNICRCGTFARVRKGIHLAKTKA